MRKSMWLLSAGLVALSMPAYAQETDTDAGGAQPTQGATAEAAAVDYQAVEPEAGSRDTSEIVVTATRRNEALSDVPLAVSAVTAESLQNSGASDIRALTQLSPSLLVFSTSSEAGAGRDRLSQDEALQLAGELAVQRLAVGPVEADTGERRLAESGLSLSR